MTTTLTTTIAEVPYAKRGEVWRTYQKHFGNDASDRVLVVNGPTRTLNPTVPQSVIDAAFEDDPVAARAEFGGQFRDDIEDFLSPEAVKAVTVEGRHELAREPRFRYVGSIDPAGGSGQDSMTLAIAHRDGERSVLDLVREERPPFSPEQVTRAFAETLRAYGISEAWSDRYAGDWPVEGFRKHFITLRPSERTRSEIYRAALPLVMSQRVELLDHPRLAKQLASLERRKGAQGREIIDAPPRQHEDVANAAAGALVQAAHRPSHGAVFMVIPGL